MSSMSWEMTQAVSVGRSPPPGPHHRCSPGARVFQYLRLIVWRQVFGWLRRKHLGTGWKELRRRYCDGGWWPHDGDVVLFNPGSVVTTRYRPRGTTIPSPWPSTT